MNEIATNIDRLRDIALEQHGFVTTSQAIEEGVTNAALSMLVKRKRLERCAHGVYRVPQVPSTAVDDLMLAVLWAGYPGAVLGYETALDIYDVSDVNPTKIHVVVPKNRRIRKKTPSDYVVHKDDIALADIAWWDQIPVVTLRKAIEQCIDGEVADYLIRQAIERGSNNGQLIGDEANVLAEKLEARYV